jgi:hypothetical protein
MAGAHPQIHLPATQAVVDDTSQTVGGLLARWENIRIPPSSKKMVDCQAAKPEYKRHEYLKHSDTSDVQGTNYHAGPNIMETRFHRGFHRRHQSEIRQDGARVEMEQVRERRRDQRANQQVNAAIAYRQNVTFDPLTGEGSGREDEFRQVGKKILNPHGNMKDVFLEHHRDQLNRQRNSKHRFFEYPAPPVADHRGATMFNEGYVGTQKESVVLGYGNANPRTKVESVGTYDNFSHTQLKDRSVQYEPIVDRNKSQIIFG